MAQQSLVGLGFFRLIYCDNFYGYVLGEKKILNKWLINKFSAIKLLQPCGS